MNHWIREAAEEDKPLAGYKADLPTAWVDPTKKPSETKGEGPVEIESLGDASWDNLYKDAFELAQSLGATIRPLKEAMTAVIKKFPFPPYPKSKETWVERTEEHIEVEDTPEWTAAMGAINNFGSEARKMKEFGDKLATTPVVPLEANPQLAAGEILLGDYANLKLQMDGLAAINEGSTDYNSGTVETIMEEVNGAYNEIKVKMVGGHPVVSFPRPVERPATSTEEQALKKEIIGPAPTEALSKEDLEKKPPQQEDPLKGLVDWGTKFDWTEKKVPGAAGLKRIKRIQDIDKALAAGETERNRDERTRDKYRQNLSRDHDEWVMAKTSWEKRHPGQPYPVNFPRLPEWLEITKKTGQNPPVSKEELEKPKPGPGPSAQEFHDKVSEPKPAPTHTVPIKKYDYGADYS